MAKIILGKRPTSFKRVVKFPMLDGSEGAIECVFKYRTRKEFGAYIDERTKAATEIIEAANAAAAEAAFDKPADAKPFSVADFYEQEVSKGADYLAGVLEGWNLDHEFSRDALEQLCDEIPAAAAEIVDAYRAAILGGRLGN